MIDAYISLDDFFVCLNFREKHLSSSFATVFSSRGPQERVRTKQLQKCMNRKKKLRSFLFFTCFSHAKTFLS